MTIPKISLLFSSANKVDEAKSVSSPLRRPSKAIPKRSRKFFKAGANLITCKTPKTTQNHCLVPLFSGPWQTIPPCPNCRDCILATDLEGSQVTWVFLGRDLGWLTFCMDDPGSTGQPSVVSTLATRALACPPKGRRKQFSGILMSQLIRIKDSRQS